MANDAMGPCPCASDRLLRPADPPGPVGDGAARLAGGALAVLGAANLARRELRPARPGDPIVLHALEGLVALSGGVTWLPLRGQRRQRPPLASPGSGHAGNDGQENKGKDVHVRTIDQLTEDATSGEPMSPSDMYRAVLVFGLLSWLSAPVRADDAKSLYQRGSSEYALGHYDSAATLFEESFAQSNEPALLFNAAQAHRLAGHKG